MRQGYLAAAASALVLAALPFEGVRADATWQAPNSDDVLPRPPLPTAPSKSNPFKVEDPNEE